MNSSSRSNPCPCCGRTKTSHCRWDDARIFCYQGVSHQPPANLARGETLTLGDGTTYFFAGYNKGFAGNSALFCLHDPSNDRFTRPVTPQAQRRQTARNLSSLEELRLQLEQAQIVTSHALAAPHYHSLTPDEIRGWMQVIQDAFKRLIAIKPQVMRLRHLDPNLKEVFKSITGQIKELAYQKADFETFWFDVLCDPSGGTGKRFAEQLAQLQAEDPGPDLNPDW
jgi:hypothetical protein